MPFTCRCHVAATAAAPDCCAVQLTTGGRPLAAVSWPQADDSSGRKALMAAELDRQAVHAEMAQARQSFRRLLDHATAPDLRRRSNGTKWTNEQLLFHMLFGYLIVRALLTLARIFGALPDGASAAFARLLDAARAPFHVINYAGSCLGARIIPSSHMGAAFDRVTAALQRRLDREPAAALRRGMHYPTSWDPFFTSYMTLADLYRYPTQHFDFHRRQLTLQDPTDSAPPT
jgi:hypothetical protein